jgi:iron complex outermembrane receptor protein
MNNLKHILLATACAAFAAAPAVALQFDIPGGDLKTALDAYAKQAGVSLIVSADAVRGAKTDGVKADLSADAALTRILSGTASRRVRIPVRWS